MEFMIVCCLLVCTVTAALGAGCDVGGVSIMVGGTYDPPGQCIQIICEAAGVFIADGCIPFNSIMDTKCTLVPGDNSKPFPNCCPHIECQ